MSGLPPGVARLILVSTTLASLLMVPGVALSLEVGEKAPDFTLPSTTGGADQPEPVSREAARAP